MPSIQRDRAWSTLTIKSLNESTREFEGIASTPATDFGGDFVDPLGAHFSLPIPLLWQHAKEHIKDPVGQITFAKASKDGIRVRGHFARFDEPPSLKDDVDRAWQLTKGGYVRGLSIGFNPTDYKPNKSGGYDILKWSWHELSAVRVGMNAEATITSIKSIDKAARASSGTPAPNTRPGASGTHSRNTTMKTFHEQIAELGEEREGHQKRMTELLATVDNDPLKLEDDAADEFKTLGGNLRTIDSKVRTLQDAIAASGKATPISFEDGTSPDRSSRVRAGELVMKDRLEPGTRFVRAMHAKIKGKIEGWGLSDAADYARRTWPDTPEVAQYLKANPGTGLSGNWAENLNVVRVVEGEFIELLRPATIIGRLGLRPAPFNTKMIRRVNVTSSANWVGNAAAKPVGEGDYDTVEIGTSKIAEIIVLTEDLVLSSAVDAIEATRVDLIERVAAFADDQFTDPSVSATANNPASVTNAVTPITPGGDTAEDLRNDIYRLLAQFSAANIPLARVTLIMSSFNALGIAGLTNALGNPEFPSVNAEGGSINGIRIIVSNNVGGDSSGSNIIAVVPSYILLAQNGGIRVDLSREATVDMAGGNSPTYSLWQKNSVGLRCEWWVSWKKAHDSAAQYIASASYFPQPAA